MEGGAQQQTECTRQLILSTECKDALAECVVLFLPGNCGTRS